MEPNEQQQLLDELTTNDIFSGLEHDQLHRMFAQARFHRLEPDSLLFEQGKRATTFFWVRKGLIKLSRLSPSGDEKVIELIGPRQTFGEALMFMGASGSYPVRAQALERSELLGFDSEEFLTLLAGSVDTCFRLLANVSRRLHMLVNEIDQLTQQSATSRLLDYLLSHADSAGVVVLNTPKNVLASRLSVKPETLSRMFARLSGEGLLCVQGATVRLCDCEALQRMRLRQD